jgi:hypothetical protein
MSSNHSKGVINRLEFSEIGIGTVDCIFVDLGVY